MRSFSSSSSVRKSVRCPHSSSALRSLVPVASSAARSRLSRRAVSMPSTVSLGTDGRSMHLGTATTTTTTRTPLLTHSRASPAAAAVPMAHLLSSLSLGVMSLCRFSSAFLAASSSLALCLAAARSDTAWAAAS